MGKRTRALRFSVGTTLLLAAALPLGCNDAELEPTSNSGPEEVVETTNVGGHGEEEDQIADDPEDDLVVDPTDPDEGTTTVVEELTE